MVKVNNKLAFVVFFVFYFWLNGCKNHSSVKELPEASNYEASVTTKLMELGELAREASDTDTKLNILVEAINASHAEPLRGYKVLFIEEYLKHGYKSTKYADYLKQLAEIYEYEGKLKQSVILKNSLNSFREGKNVQNFPNEDLLSGEILLIKSSTHLDTIKALDYISLTKTIALVQPGDSTAAAYLLRSADFAIGIGSYNEAIQLYTWIHDHFPNFSKRQLSLFLKAFIIETKLNNTEEAKKAYQDFIQKYPKDLLAKDAQISLESI